MANVAINQQDLSFTSDLLPFLKDPSFLYAENPMGENYDGSQIGFPIGLDLIQRYDFKHEGHTKSVYEICLMFCKAVFGNSFNKSHPAYSNFLYVGYTEDNLTRFSRPTIALFDGKPRLVMGSQSKEEGREYVTAPLAVVQNDNGRAITFENSLIKKLQISSVEYTVMATQEKKKAPVATFRASDVVYSISVRTIADTPYFDVADYWQDCNLEKLSEIIAPLYGASANLTNMFAEVFASNRFPEEGVLIKVIGAKADEAPAKDGKGSFLKAVFTIDSKGLRPYRVKAYSDGENTFVTLPEVSTISAYWSHEAATPLKQKKTPPTASNPWYLHIKGIGGNVNTVPKHQIYAGFVPPKFYNQFPEILGSKTAGSLAASNVEEIDLNMEDTPEDDQDMVTVDAPVITKETVADMGKDEIMEALNNI